MSNESLSGKALALHSWSFFGVSKESLSGKAFALHSGTFVNEVKRSEVWTFRR